MDALDLEIKAHGQMVGRLLDGNSSHEYRRGVLDAAKALREALHGQKIEGGLPRKATPAMVAAFIGAGAINSDYEYRLNAALAAAPQ